MMHEPLYDPSKTYEENFSQGPFGAFADGQVYAQQGEPQFNFLGHSVYAPFGIAAGPLLNAKFVKAAFEKGFDIATYKTVRSSAHECADWPNVLPVNIQGDLTLETAARGVTSLSAYASPLSITNSFGVPSKDPSFWQDDMRNAMESAGKGQVMIGSFQGTAFGNGNFNDYLKDYVLAARLVMETGAKLLEANLSCPNEGKAELLCYDIARVLEIAHTIKDEIGNTPLILKLGFFENQDQLEQLVKRVGGIVQGFATINTIPAKVSTPAGDQALPGKGRAVSGICGASILWAGLDMVSRLAKLRQRYGMEFSIIGVGGASSVEDFQAYQKKGADAVMSATASMWNPYLAQEIKENYL
jgi:dihydroorotate dehydrogenase